MFKPLLGGGGEYALLSCPRGEGNMDDVMILAFHLCAMNSIAGETGWAMWDRGGT